MKKVILLIFCLLPLLQFSQDFSESWEGHFSYHNIKAVTQGNNKVFAASENAVFFSNNQTNELEEITTINGLSGEAISTIYYSPIYELLIIGYENGLLEVVFDNDSEVLTIVDIFEKTTIQPTEKRINHFSSYNNNLYIATNYGISVFDLERLEFGDTYFIGANGAQIPVTQTTVFDNYIYASCSNNYGLKRGDVTSPNLIDYQNWTTIATGSWLGVESQVDKLYAINANKKMYEVVNHASISQVAAYTNTPLDLQSVEDRLIVTTQTEVFVYDSSFNSVAQVGLVSEFSTRYTSAIIDQNYIYIGSENYGILKTPISSPTVFEEVHPEGPLMNKPFKIQASVDGLWVTFGEYTEYYNPYPLNIRGFSHLKYDEWINTPDSEVFDAVCLNVIAINPSNTGQVYLSSFFSGLLEVNDEVATVLYNETNSGLESLIVPNNPSLIDIRVGGAAFDDEGLLWTTTGFVDRALKSFDQSNNQWQSYDFTSVIGSVSAGGNSGYPELLIASDGTKWIASSRYGLIGFQENGNSQLLKGIYTEEQNMPSYSVTSLALDQRNQLWIGTSNGLRVLYNTSNFFTDNIQVDEIIIEEDGIAKELLFQQHITAIEVDGSNNKWVSTTDAGLFYFSADGQNTIFHFTKTNSPLPSNTVLDLSIDGDRGIVHIATDKGLVSFFSGGSSPIESLDSAFVYPNPVRPGFDMFDKKVKIKDISENVNIKITDIEGNLVAEAQSKTNQRYSGYNLEIDGGTAYWNGKNLANNTVASGVYLVMLSDLDTFETKVIKLMVVR
ncbi:two-component regulator propeller domain-containing protein [Tamlana sp. 2_MG-2023]|uniref:type IX secretion system anionic LPS delivery protein PorZ n=1 Tax=unclassified Tamlana TaxID=2614803 RepID=UPI0026E15E05|nr:MULTISPECIES: two-component regulator propeller domain-containing protein [unclassified Tamlana]MDO6759875.1 two-component regulator propeller domain-containing protein [Tamlana sp. 2_MG-2023]MDO6791955.1 two-component regulator propeller domain-containing protein [Tamlana sp. 1_MG-2023]